MSASGVGICVPPELRGDRGKCWVYENHYVTAPPGGPCKRPNRRGDEGRRIGSCDRRRRRRRRRPKHHQSAGRFGLVVGVDAEGLASGLRAVPVAYRVLRVYDGEFIATLVDLCALEQCRLVFPGRDPELPVLAAAARYTEAGATVVVSDPEERDGGRDLDADLPVYFAHAYSPAGERRQREYHDLIREYLPKGTEIHYDIDNPRGRQPMH